MIRILALDDAKVIQSLLKLTLESDGMKVDVASTIKEAEAYINQNQYDAMIIDYMLENGHNGLQFLESIDSNSKNAQIPAILLSAEAGEQRKNTAKDLGVKVWMTKPFTPVGLLNTLYTLLGKDNKLTDSDKTSIHHRHS